MPALRGLSAASPYAGFSFWLWRSQALLHWHGRRTGARIQAIVMPPWRLTTCPGLGCSSLCRRPGRGGACGPRVSPTPTKTSWAKLGHGALQTVTAVLPRLQVLQESGAGEGDDHGAEGRGHERQRLSCLTHEASMAGRSDNGARFPGPGHERAVPYPGMSVSETVLSYLRVLAWPALVGILALAFRSTVRSLLQVRLTQIDAGGFSAKFSEIAQEAEQVVQAGHPVRLSPPPARRSVSMGLCGLLRRSTRTRVKSEKYFALVSLYSSTWEWTIVGPRVWSTSPQASFSRIVAL
jgi:hypothetical protein